MADIFKGRFDEIYSKALENQPSASQETKNHYNAMHSSFEDYLASVEETVFRYAYELGYHAAEKQR